MWRYLLRSNCLVEKLQVIEIGEYERVGIGVVRMGISFLHVLEFILIISLSISLLVSGFSPAAENKTSINIQETRLVFNLTLTL